ncbi:MAG TPA: CBS domain-containing protein [Vicinamibacteria bacterium]|nr:CBS domain-containing protein [Vicinamibacteria bacterium]HRB13262.1 CBS domain-containing protein [Vicinamibacteria bacterium]
MPFNLKVRDVMTPNPVTLSPEESLMEALQMMRLRKIRRIPVVSAAGKLVGLLTEGDLKRAEPSTLSDTQEQFMAVMEGTQVNRIMIQNLVTTTPDTLLIDAARTLFRNKYGALPVLDGEKLVGILTDNDLIGALVKVLESHP